MYWQQAYCMTSDIISFVLTEEKALLPLYTWGLNSLRMPKHPPSRDGSPASFHWRMSLNQIYRLILFLWPISC